MNKVLVDKARLLRRVIIISWITLALCFVVKIFGGNFFEIMCENQNYKALCEYSDRHLWLENTLAFISSYICQMLYVLAILQKYKPNKKEFAITTVSVFLSVVLRDYSFAVGLIFDIWLMAGLPMLFIWNKWKKYWQIPVAWAMTFVFQFVSLVVKDLAIKPVDESTFVALIYMIDLYLMCFIYYLYRNFEKEKKEMGKFWVMFAGKPVDKLKEMKAKRENQIAKLNEEIKAIEQEIAKQNSEKK